jgi:hypothetical protein
MIFDIKIYYRINIKTKKCKKRLRFEYANTGLLNTTRHYNAVWHSQTNSSHFEIFQQSIQKYYICSKFC